jgi:hypothetical protein
LEAKSLPISPWRIGTLKMPGCEMGKVIQAAEGGKSILDHPEVKALIQDRFGRGRSEKAHR